MATTHTCKTSAKSLYIKLFLLTGLNVDAVVAELDRVVSGLEGSERSMDQG